MTDSPASNPRSIIGLLLCRLVVPLWILTGATFKLIESNPGLLPRGILSDADRLGLNLDFVLAALISLEFLAIAVMVFVRRFARFVAIFMLSVFCLVLLREIAAGNTSCGCLGAKSPSPWVMLAIDATLLVGVSIFPAQPIPWLDAKRWPAVIGAVLAAACTGLTFAQILPHDAPPPPPPPVEAPALRSPEAPDETPEKTPEVKRPKQPAPLALPSFWFGNDFESWIGRHWTDIELFRFMRRWPTGIDRGTKFVVFYSRTCDHCEEMFHDDLLADPVLAAQVTAIEIPAEADKLRGSGAWEMPPTNCELLELPLGVNWIITPPLALRVEDGIVRCATEGEHTTCLGLPPKTDSN